MARCWNLSLMRVRALHAQNQPTETAHAGQRIALNIAGDVPQQQGRKTGGGKLEPPVPQARRLVEILFLS